MLPAEGHNALRLMTEIPASVTKAKGGGVLIKGATPSATEVFHAEISIETAFWDPREKTAKCLRCSHLLQGCDCKYANDLLLPVKKNECRLLAQPTLDPITRKELPTGNVGVMLRIPRTRTKPTAAQNAVGVKKSNAWLRNLPNCGHGVCDISFLFFSFLFFSFLFFSPSQ